MRQKDDDIRDDEENENKDIKDDNNNNKFKKILNRLLSYSLIFVKKNKKLFKMYKLVQLVIRE